MFVFNIMISINRKCHILKSLFISLHGLMTALWEPKFKRYFRYLDVAPANFSKQISASKTDQRIRSDTVQLRSPEENEGY